MIKHCRLYTKFFRPSFNLGGCLDIARSCNESTYLAVNSELQSSSRPQKRSRCPAIVTTLNDVPRPYSCIHQAPLKHVCLVVTTVRLSLHSGCYTDLTIYHQTSVSTFNCMLLRQSTLREDWQLCDSSDHDRYGSLCDWFSPCICRILLCRDYPPETQRWSIDTPINCRNDYRHHDPFHSHGARYPI